MKLCLVRYPRSINENILPLHKCRDLKKWSNTTKMADLLHAGGRRVGRQVQVSGTEHLLLVKITLLSHSLRGEK